MSAGVIANGVADKKPTACQQSSLRSIIVPLEALIYWRDVYRSGGTLATLLAVLVSLSFCSLISVVSYFSLLALSAAFGFRVYSSVRHAVNKTGSDANPLQDMMTMDLSLSAEKIHCAADCFIVQFNRNVAYLQRVFLIQDFVESLKFGVLLYMLTYLGGWMNGLTILTLGVVAAFSLPKAYEVNKTQVDMYLSKASQQVNMLYEKVKSVIPIGGGAAKDKEQ